MACIYSIHSYSVSRSLTRMDSQVAAVGEERGGDRWDNSFQEVDESREKLESVKVAVVSAVVGTVALLPLLFFGYAHYYRL